MRMAAEANGATLLPALPSRVIRAGTCVHPTRPQAQMCTSWTSDDDLAFRWRSETGQELVGVRVTSPSWMFARLARRANTLVLLVPVVTRHQLSEQRQCECHRDYGYFDFEGEIESVFLVEDMPIDGVEVVNVPIVEDFILWRCDLVVQLAQASCPPNPLIPPRFSSATEPRPRSSGYDG